MLDHEEVLVKEEGEGSHDHKEVLAEEGGKGSHGGGALVLPAAAAAVGVTGIAMVVAIFSHVAPP